MRGASLYKKSRAFWQSSTRKEIDKMIEDQKKPIEIAQSFKVTDRAVQIRAKKLSKEMPVGKPRQEKDWEDIFMARKKKEEAKSEENNNEDKTEITGKEANADVKSRSNEPSDAGNVELSSGKIDDKSDSSTEDTSFSEEVKKTDLVREKENTTGSGSACEVCFKNGTTTELRKGQKRCHECGCELEW